MSGDSHGDGLVGVLFCCGDSFEEDLRCGPKLGILVELDDVDDTIVTLFKIVEALKGTFFFSTSVELKTKGPGGGGAGREIIDSNTSLPFVLTSNFLAVSAIYFDRSDLAWTDFSGRILVHRGGRAT